MPITQENRLLSLTTPLPYNDLLIKRLRAFEAVSQLFRIELEIVKETEDLAPPAIKDVKKLIGQPMTVTVNQVEDGTSIKRHFNGICVSFSQGGRTLKFTNYRAELVPHVWLLTQRSQSRIFQQKNVPDILTKVFDGFDVKFELNGHYEPRNYCVQYRETDFNFASRLMEEEGIFYFFDHTENGHKLVVADTPQSHKPVSKATIPYVADRSGVEEMFQSSIISWNFDDRVQTGKYTLWDHHFELVGKTLEAQQLSRHDIGGNRQLEIYDWPGGYAKRYDGISPGGGAQASEIQKIFEDNKRTVNIRQQEIDVAYKTIYGTSDCCAIVPGFKFQLSKHPYEAYNSSYTFLTVRTEAVQNPWYMSTEDVEMAYSVNFVVLPLESPFRPLRQTPKPVVHGCQTAVVVGPAGEEISTDKYGRVKVQFHWDREGRNDQASSCWMRVAQMWAGKKWGTMFIPRIGMEVIVDFLEGDPDQPIIIGAVHNAENMPAYTLPDEKTKSYIKTNSSKGGGGFNEIRFEDKKGEEQFFIHAERDHETRVKRDQKAIIKRDKHTIVEENHYEKVKRDKHLGVTGDQVEKVDGNVHLKVGSNKEQKIGMKYAVDSGQQIHLKAGMSVVIEGGVDVTLKAGGNFVNVGPSGVSIKGTMVLINSGGAAGSGGGASPNAPKDPLEADRAEAGQVTKAPSPPPPPQPVKFAKLAAVVRGGGGGGPLVTSSIPEATADALQSQAARLNTSDQGSARAALAESAAAAAAAAQSKANEVKDRAEAMADNLADKAGGALGLAEDLKDKAASLADQALAAAQAAKDKMAQAADEVKQAVEDAKTAAQEKIDEAKQALDEAKQAAQEKVNEAKEALADAQAQVEQAAAEMKDQAQQAADQAQQALDDAKQQAQAQVEDAKQAVADAQQQAEEAVQQAQEQAQQAAQEAKDQVGQAAEQAQQQAEQAAQQAQDAAAGAADEAAKAADEVSQQAGQALQSAMDAIPFM